jgi:hypothetical protein
MKLVYILAKDLEVNPRRVQSAQKLTRDRSRPTMGLKGTHGLFGSQEWWTNVELGKFPLQRIAGIIVDAYVGGQDHSGTNNTIDLKDEDGTVHSVGIYVNDPRDTALFTVGRRAEILYALDELKDQPADDGGMNYAQIALEMAVSTDDCSPL